MAPPSLAAQVPSFRWCRPVGGLANHAGPWACGPRRRYFNAGVMLIDIGRWRTEHVGSKAFEFTRRHLPILQQYDQDSLNAVLAGRWKELDPRWQVQPGPRIPSAANRRTTRTSFISAAVSSHGSIAAGIAPMPFSTSSWTGRPGAAPVPARTLRSLGAGSLYDSPIRPRALFPPRGARTTGGSVASGASKLAIQAEVALGNVPRSRRSEQKSAVV